MEKYLNLNHQTERPPRKKLLLFFLILSFIMSFTCAVLLITQGAQPSWLIWFYLFYSPLQALSFYMQLKGSSLLDLIGKAYIKWDDTGLAFKPGIFKREEIYFKWDEIQDVRVKLFEVEVKKDDEWITLNLEKLSDDNLKLIKQAFRDKEQQLTQRLTVAAI
jgi:hypothetical protein